MIKWSVDLKNTFTYDIEVTCEDYMITFYNPQEEKQFINTIEGLQEFVDNNIILAYNDRGYDNIVLSTMLRTNGNQYEIKKCSDTIINTKKNNRVAVDYLRKRYPVNWDLKSLDLMSEIIPDDDVNTLSLKMIEANWGDDIIESEIDFNIDRKLTEDELQTMAQYNLADTKAAWKVLMQRKEYFDNHHMLVEMAMKYGTFRNKYECKYWTLMKKSETALTGIILQNNSVFEFDWNSYNVPQDVIDFWKQEVRLWDLLASGKIEKKPQNVYTKMVGNCTFDFSSGGGHGKNVLKKIFASDCMYEPDVTSLYPTLMINDKIFGDKTDLYKTLYDERIRLKKMKDDKEAQNLQALYKLILNKAYGGHGNRYNKLYNKHISLHVCFRGQEILWQMANAYHINGMELVQVNTDGIMIIDNYNRLNEVNKELEEKLNVKLEAPKFTKVIQKNVNNYIAVGDDEIKIKGAFNNIDGTSYFKNNNEAIINLCVYNHYIHNKSVVDTIEENKRNYVLFQYNCKISRAYSGVAYFDKFEETKGRVYNDIFLPLWKNRYNDNFKTLLKHFESEINKINKNAISLDNFEITEDLEAISRGSTFASTLREILVEEYPNHIIPKTLYKAVERDYFVEDNVKVTTKGNVYRTFQVLENSNLEKGILRKQKEVNNVKLFDKFPNSGYNSYIYLNAINTLPEDFHEQLDMGYYIKRANDTIKDFLKEKNER